jgi:hypothetical protein
MQSDSEVPMQASEAQQTLSEIERVRRETRRDLHPLGYGNVVAGLFFAGATLCSAVASGPALPIAYWVIGATVGLALIVRHEMRRERELGAEARITDPEFGIFLVMIAGIAAVNALTSGTFGKVAWAYPVAAAWLVLAARYRDAAMRTAGVAFIAAATAIFVLEPGSEGLWTQLAMAILLIAAGLAGQARERA